MEQQQSRWRPTRRHLLWTGGIIVALVGAYIFLRFAYVREWKWTGLVKDDNYHKRTLWDWLKLLIIPVVLAIGGYLFTRSESRRTQDIANQQRDLDREIADQRRQDDTLQAYLDGMAQLLTDKDRPLHRAQRGDSLSTVARAWTLTVLSRLDDGRKKRSVVEFLYESGLIAQEQTLLAESDLIERRHNIVSLAQADLRRADLTMADLSEANLAKANLIKANLFVANLSGAYLFGTDLRGAFLSGTDLRGAFLRGALLSGAYLFGTNLRGAFLRGALLSEADLSGGTNLSGANLSGADLSGAFLHEAVGWTEEQLAAATTLEGATMPNGQKYEEWLKSKGHGDDGKNSGPS